MRGDVPERASGGGLAAAPGLGVLAYAGFAPGIADRRFAEPATTGHRECAGYAFALTYGPGTDWVKNVLAAGSCELRAAHARAHRPAGLPACVPRREPARHPPLRTPGPASPRRRRLPDPQDGTRSSHKFRPAPGVTAEINYVLRRQPGACRPAHLGASVGGQTEPFGPLRSEEFPCPAAHGARNIAAVARGRLRVYLGAAPGVGKTYAMLAEGQRRRARGTDVVVALVEAHGRRLTAAMAEGLELVPRRTMSYRGAAFTEMDLDAVLARRPQVALVDELAHTNVPGCRNPKRWQDVDELLDAGIDVITTLNIQHLESLSDVTKQVTGVEQHETLPDEIARRADQIELVDMTPEALRRRMVHGNVYPPDRIEAALTHYFRPGNLTALRELALLWVADRVEEGLQRSRASHGIAAPWETRERIVVGIAGEKDDEAVIRRAARIAARTPGSDLLAVHVKCDDGLAVGRAATLDTQRALVALLAGKSIPTRLARRAEHVDVHLVSREGAGRRRPGLAWLLAAPRSRRGRALRASAEAAALTRLAASVLRGCGDLPALLGAIPGLFGLG